MSIKNYEPKEKATSGIIDASSRPIEMIYDPETNKTSFVCLKGKKILTLNRFCKDPRSDLWLVPYSPDNDLIQNGMVLFPSCAENYKSEKELVKTIQEFIHHYLAVSPFFEKIASYYVLFTWIYDNFNELPYLRAIGDFGSGKSRFLKTVGSICYKPIFANGATTISPIFRLIDEFRGTLIIDEADLSRSDFSCEMIKILNSGHEKGSPVIRSESLNGKEYSPKSFNVYGPKILSTREFFTDKALESRFIVEEMPSGVKLRHDLPINLPNDFAKQALKIRNKLLMFRLKNYGKRTINEKLVDHTLEARLNQITVPLMSIIDDAELQQELKESVQRYYNQMVNDRGMEFDGQILEAIKELIDQGDTEPLIGRIKEKLIQKYGSDCENVTARGIGARIRKAFRLHTKKTREGYIIPKSEKATLERFYERYGLVNNVNDVNVSQPKAKDESEGVDIDDIINQLPS